ncbi:MAG: chemotaxis protein CheA [Proteobacteria bacterium]|nr:chemotaxis protein CheA [Pseudomonadota bacterium]
MTKKKSDQKRYNELFVDESNEQLQNLNQTLLRLESHKDDEEALNEAFRLVHTIKGTANILGFHGIGKLAHTMEDVFDNIRSRKIPFSQEMIDIFFEGTDLLTSKVAEVNETGIPTSDSSGFIERLNILIGNTSTDKFSNERTIINSSEGIAMDEEKKLAFLDARSGGYNLFLVTFKLGEDCKLKEGRIFQAFRTLGFMGEVIASTPDTKHVEKYADKVFVLLATSKSDKEVQLKIKSVPELEDISIEVVNTLADLELHKMPGEKRPAAKRSFYTSETVRVKSRYLDSLLDLVGELMISEIRVKQIADDIKHKELRQALKNNNRLIGELQDNVLRMRMVPLDYIFKRFSRMIRDMSKDAGKEIDFRIEGSDIEIDRSLLDDVGDSLMHILRNSIDHGIEPEEERKEKKKTPRGSILLKAHGEKGNVVIEVTDDGRGIDPDKVVEAAISKGLISKEEANYLDEKRKMDIAFLPGLSTAKEVSEVSGRGVGLDVVKQKITDLGGTVGIDSKLGKEARVSVKLPPSMAIIKAMLVEVTDEKYAIPLENIIEIIRIGEEDIHNIMDTGVFKLRDDVLPLLNLHEEFGGELPQGPKSHVSVVIVEKDGINAGLVVSTLLGQQEIVIKSLGAHMRKNQYFSGATILGDGKVAMILDVGALI